MRGHAQASFRCILACLAILLWFAAPGAAQLATPVSVETQATADFPNGITFEATIPVEDSASIEGAALYYRIASDRSLHQATVSPDALVVNEDSVSVSRVVNMRTAFVPSGVSLEYFWEVTTSDGETIATAVETTRWIDTRFDWTESRSEQIRLYSYGMSGDFVSWMLRESQAILDDLESRYDLEEIESIAIWIYPDTGDFAGSRQANTREAIAGISYPGASLIVAVVPDGNQREFGRVVPHEISHQALFHATENPFAPPPLWLDEGLATHYQEGGTDRYDTMVWRAANDNTLFDITSLNSSFPYQPSRATLAYASSWSMVDYIEATYGAEGIARLINAFAAGRPVDDAIESALGIPIDQLNADWHAWVLDQGDPGD